MATSTLLLVAREQNKMAEKKTVLYTDNTFNFPVMDSCDSKIENFVPKSKK